MASRSAVMALMPCLTAVDRSLRMVSRLRVALSLVSRPEIFCWVLFGRRSRSARFVRRRDGGVVAEPQDVVVAVVEAGFRQGSYMTVSGESE
jgi:hypothetical protein